MKKSDVVLTLVLIAFVICVCLAIYFNLNNQNNKEISNIDLETLEENIMSDTVFSDMTLQDIDKSMLKSIFDIDEEKVLEVVGKTPLINIYSSMFVIVKTDNSNAKYIEQKFNEYGLKYEEQWKKYLPEQYELVKKREVGRKGNYVYFIVSDSANEIVNMIK